jgi:hypothetical protein
MRKRGIFLASLFVNSLVAAQEPASCTFKTFSNTLYATSPLETLKPLGVNDWLTVVGDTQQSSTSKGGFIRWPNGSVQLSKIHFVSRNDNGATLGWIPNNGKQEPLIITGSITNPSLVEGSVNFGSKFLQFYTPTAINDWTSVVGYYQDSSKSFHGLKRWSDSFINQPSDSVGLCSAPTCPGIQLDFPNASSAGAFSGTFPTGINDSGTIVGYEGLLIATHGFIYSGGKWATLDFHSAVPVTYTELMGIANDTTIVGFADLTDGETFAFMYRKGKFKTISFPNSQWTAISGIGLKTDIIVGEALGIDNVLRTFTAKCN